MVRDINVDLNLDNTLIQSLLAWTNNHPSALYTPNSPSSMRLNRIIDYTFISGTTILLIFKYIIKIQRVIISKYFRLFHLLLQNRTKEKSSLKSLFFSFLSAFSFSFLGRKKKKDMSFDVTYNGYIEFLFVLSIWCTTYFTLKKYCPFRPFELRSFI